MSRKTRRSSFPTSIHLFWNPAFLLPPINFGSDFRLFHDQLFSKPAKHGGVVAWHQDYSYWNHARPIIAEGILHWKPQLGTLDKNESDMDAVRDSAKKFFDHALGAWRVRKTGHFDHSMTCFGTPRGRHPLLFESHRELRELSAELPLIHWRFNGYQDA